MKYDFTLTAWNAVTTQEFIVSESKRDYEERFYELENLILNAPRVKLVDSYVVKSLEDAYAIYKQHLLDGKEGCIIKRRAGKWKDNTSKDDIKLKMKFEIDMEITGYYEGTGKYAGTLGGLSLRSAEGKVISNCGSGPTDKERDELWALGDALIGRIAAIEINDIVSKEGTETFSLNLPIYIELRTFEKKVADTLERIIEIREAAKSGTKLK